MDITLATDEITLSHTGGSDVYVTGYQTVAINMEDDEDGYMLGSSDDEEGDEGERVWGPTPRGRLPAAGPPSGAAGRAAAV